MPWSSGQLDAGPTVFSSQANLVLILLTHLRDERPNQPYLAAESNLGSVLWQRKSLTTEQRAYDKITLSIKFHGIPCFYFPATLVTKFLLHSHRATDIFQNY